MAAALNYSLHFVLSLTHIYIYYYHVVKRLHVGVFPQPGGLFTSAEGKNARLKNIYISGYKYDMMYVFWINYVPVAITQGTTIFYTYLHADKVHSRLDMATFS